MQTQSSNAWARRHIAGRFGVQLIGMLLCVPAITVISTSDQRLVLWWAMFAYGAASWLYFSNLWTATFEIVDPTRDDDPSIQRQ